MHVLVTATYVQALGDLVDHLLDVGALAAAQRLEVALLDHWLDALAVHPRAGRDYLQRNLPTQEVEKTRAQVAELYGADVELREIVEGDYLILYAIRGDALYLLTVRHQRTSGFGMLGS